MPQCQLCLEETVLCKSHIYPEYMYKHCYNKNHTFIEFNAGDNSYNQKRSKGLYEKLLCRNCENIIKKYEDYAKSVIYDEFKPTIRRNKAPLTIHPYNYKEFKLFILSLLWRASMSSLKSFKLAKLGDLYNEALRTILLKGLETDVDYFPCYLYQTHSGNNLMDGVFMEMYSTKEIFLGRTIYQFIVDGLYIFIGVGRCSIKIFKQGSSISPENLRIGYDEICNLEKFMNLYNRLESQNKFKVYKKL